MADPLGTAFVTISPAPNTAATFRTQLLKAIETAKAGIVVPIPVVAAGLGAGAGTASKEIRTLAVAQEEVTATAGVATVALTEEAAAASAGGIAATKSAAEVRRAAKAHEAFARGAGATTLAMGGLRGATLAASTPFLLGAAAITTFAKSIKASSNEAEALAAVERVLGEEGARTSEIWAKQLATSFGLSASAALRAEAGFAQLFSVQGLGRKRAEELSQQFTELSSDMSTFLGLPIERVFNGLQLGIAGNIRGFKTLKIVTSAAEIAAKALTLSGKKEVDQLTRQNLVMARVAIINEQTANAQGAFADRSGDLAGQAKILRSNLENTAVTLGNELEPALRVTLVTLNKVVGAFRVFAGAHVEDIFGRIAVSGNSAIEKMIALKFSGDNLAKGMFALLAPLRVVATSLSAIGVEAATAALSTRQLAADLAGLQGQLLDIQFAGGTTAQQRANLQRQLKKAEQGVKDADALGKGGLEARKKRNQIQDQITALDKEEADKAKSASDKAKSAADAAASAAKAAADAAAQRKADADQAFLAAQEFARGQAEIKIARAANTKQLGDDIQAELAERNLILKQIAEIKKSNIAQGLKKLALQAARLLLVQVNGALKELNAEKAANRKAAREQREADRKARQDALLESLQLDIQFAQTIGNTAREERAHRALIRELRRELRNKHLSIVERKRLRNAIAEEEKAIKELQAAEKKKNNAAASLQFEFLQAQQGFAANLLSNILPASAFAGTVGGVSGAAGGGLPISTFGGGREDPTRGLGGAAAIAQASQRTASQSQMSVLIELTRQIVRVLQGQQRGAGHPEARHQRSAGSANMDIL